MAGPKKPIGWAADSPAAPVEHMAADHRRADVPVSQKFLDRPDIVAVFREMRGKGMAQRVRAGWLGDTSLQSCLLSDQAHLLPEDCIAQETGARSGLGSGWRH